MSAVPRGAGAASRVLRPGEAGYPALLAVLPKPPAELRLRGLLPGEGVPAVAVVGTREPSAYGRRMARALAQGLARAGVWVVSGLARGVDGEAHAACLEAGGRTVAVLGSGLDRVWPPEHRPLAERIAASGGGLLSPFGDAEPPLRWHFPLRNGVISGLCLGVVVVEGGRDSGSMITASLALDQGREVFAVPGLADDPLSQGPLDLIRDGARPVRGALEVLEALGLPADPAPGPRAGAPAAPEPGLRGEPPAPDPPDLSPSALRLWRALGPGPLEPGEAGAKAGLDARGAAVALTELEVRGLARSRAGRVSQA